MVEQAAHKLRRSAGLFWGRVFFTGNFQGELSRVGVQIPMQNYKFLRTAAVTGDVVILVNIQTHTQTEPDRTAS